MPFEERPPPSEGEFGDGYLNLPEGQLVCVQHPAKAKVEEEDTAGGGGGDSSDVVRSLISEMFENKAKKPRAIGCCPRGDPTGKVFHDGSSCCVDQIFNTTTHMCCPHRERVLALSEESLQYCYGSTCLLEDLGLDAKHLLRKSCTLDKLGTPTRCLFTCPYGSQIRGTKVTQCVDGKWTAFPQCCEGCPSTFRQDLNFIVDLNADIGVGHQADVRSLIRLLVSYMQVSQDGVRVSVTSFNGDVMTDKRSWPLTDHDNHKDLNSAIDNLQDFKLVPARRAGAALHYMSTHGFTNAHGDRKHVEDVFVYIATGNPTDSVMEAATLLTEKSNFIVMALGPNIDSEFFETIPADHKLRVESFPDLNLHRKYLYELLCGSNCLTA